MSKIKSTKAFKNAVNEAFDTQTLRDKAKREYDALHRDFDEKHDTLCNYADEHPEVFDPGTCGRSREGSTDRVKFKLTTGEGLERIDGGSLTDKTWLNTLPDDYVRQKPELNRLAIKGANLSDEELAELGLCRTETRTMKLVATGDAA